MYVYPEMNYRLILVLLQMAIVLGNVEVIPIPFAATMLTDGILVVSRTTHAICTATTDTIALFL